jgi:hypothetical protein
LKIVESLNHPRQFGQSLTKNDTGWSAALLEQAPPVPQNSVMTRNETVWLKQKAELKDRGLTLPFSILQDLAVKIAAKLAGW